MPPLLFRLAPYTVGALLAVPGAALATRGLFADAGAFDLEPGQAALVIGAPGTEPRSIERAGRHRVRAPFERATVVDTRPMRLAFGAEHDPEGTDVLRVRSRNGSVFTLDGLEIQWRVDVDRIATAVDDGAAGAGAAADRAASGGVAAGDAGPDGDDPDGASEDGASEGGASEGGAAPDEPALDGSPRAAARGEAATQRGRVRLLATAALRDAFGALDSEAVADAFRAREALEVARAELGALLERHGLELLAVVAPKPRFDREYEHAIEQRKLLEQEAERLEAEREAFPETVATMLEKTRANQRLTAEMLESELAKAEAEARATGAGLVSAARIDADERRASGAAEGLRLEAEADSRRAIGASEAASLAAEIDAFEAHGDAAVREALIERLGAIRFEVAPTVREDRP